VVVNKIWVLLQLLPLIHQFQTQTFTLLAALASMQALAVLLVLAVLVTLVWVTTEEQAVVLAGLTEVWAAAAELLGILELAALAAAAQLIPQGTREVEAAAAAAVT